MNLEFLKIHSLSDLLTKYNVSWLTSAGLTLSGPSLEIYLPIIIQVLFIIFTQLFAIAVDFLRLKYLAQKSKTTLKVNGDKLEVKTEFYDQADKKDI